MYIITDKKKNTIIGIGQEMDYLSNGYPRLIEENTAFVTEQVNISEVATVPDEVEEEKYCYTAEKGFYPNPDWVEPETDDIDTVLTELEKEVGINE